MNSPTEYDPRYLAGIWFFNERDFFEAHEVWEELWADCAGADRRFFQALIQAAVALFHFGNGNVRGAVRLFHSSKDYMATYGPFHHGLDVQRFWVDMGTCFDEIIHSEPAPSASLRHELIPSIELSPPPDAWPDPEAYLRKD